MPWAMRIFVWSLNKSTEMRSNTAPAFQAWDCFDGLLTLIFFPPLWWNISWIYMYLKTDMYINTHDKLMYVLVYIYIYIYTKIYTCLVSFPFSFYTVLLHPCNCTCPQSMHREGNMSSNQLTKMDFKLLHLTTSLRFAVWCLMYC